MATKLPTDDPTFETCDYVVSEPTMEMEPYGIVSHVPMAMTSRNFPVAIASDKKFKVTRGFGGTVENAKVNVGKLYLHQVFAGGNADHQIQRQGLGKTAVNHWRIYDGPDHQARLVATTHGMHTLAGKWCHWFNLEFEVERFKGSTLQVMGANEAKEWAIVGGTGEFAMARGIINRTVVPSFSQSELTQELTIDFFCRMKEVPAAPTMRGIVGPNNGTLWEMQGKSQRLENVTIYHVGAVEGFQFSYVDEDGKIRTPGIWGKMGPEPWRKEEITFGPSEFVKQIRGRKRDNWMSKFEIVTTHKTYGPFGSDNGDQNYSYTVTVPEGETVVGFFAKTFDTYLNTIGLYTI